MAEKKFKLTKEQVKQFLPFIIIGGIAGVYALVTKKNNDAYNPDIIADNVPLGNPNAETGGSGGSGGGSTQPNEIDMSGIYSFISDSFTGMNEQLRYEFDMLEQERNKITPVAPDTTPISHEIVNTTTTPVAQTIVSILPDSIVPKIFTPTPAPTPTVVAPAPSTIAQQTTAIAGIKAGTPVTSTSLWNDIYNSVKNGIITPSTIAPAKSPEIVKQEQQIAEIKAGTPVTNVSDWQNIYNSVKAGVIKPSTIAPATPTPAPAVVNPTTRTVTQTGNRNVGYTMD